MLLDCNLCLAKHSTSLPSIIGVLLENGADVNDVYSIAASERLVLAAARDGDFVEAKMLLDCNLCLAKHSTSLPSVAPPLKDKRDRERFSFSYEEERCRLKKWGNSFGCSASSERLVSAAARDGDFVEAKMLLDCNLCLAKHSTSLPSVAPPLKDKR
ncbi:unnamed protein product, partial [Microthlaspi erraticum]